MNRKKTFSGLIILLFSFMYGNGYAFPLKGIITDYLTHEPIAYANISVMNRDSIVIEGTSSDWEGYFELGELPREAHILSISYLGYETCHLPLTAIEPEEILNITLSSSSITLGEVTIQAHAILIKEDRKIILPTQEQLVYSTDGADMLRKMQLPRIMVDPVSNEIMLSGKGEIQLRINGVQVTHTEISALSPTDILRIEYYDAPGARYGNVEAVIDYITRHKESGVNLNGLFFNNLGSNRVSADDKIAVKLNKGNSELSANAYFIQRKQKWTREYDEELIFPDYTIHRIEKGEPTLFNKMVFGSNVNYSLAKKGVYFFNAQLRYTYNHFPNGFDNRKTTLYSSETDTPLSIYNHIQEEVHSPAIDLYYQHTLPHNRLLIFNVVGTYIDTDSRHTYREKQEESVVTDLFSDIIGQKYSLISEAIYEKDQRGKKLTLGGKHIQAYTNNQYRGNANTEVALHQAESFLYAEYQAKYGKLGYMANLTGLRLYYSQGATHREKYALQPGARLTFEPNPDSYLSYRINLRNVAPSPAYLNDVEQAIDFWQIRRGNPGLHTYQALIQNFAAGYNQGVWGMDLSMGYEREYKPVMEGVFYEDGKFIRTYENQRSFHNLSAEIGIHVKPWKDYLSFSLTPRIERFISYGNTYTHTYTMAELRINVDFSYNNWIANFTTYTPRRYMYGEYVTKSEQMYTLMAGYKMHAWTLTIGALNPFTKEFKTHNESWASLNPVTSKIHTTHNKSFMAKLAFNLNYGKQAKAYQKRITNADNDAGIISGSKE